MLTKQNVQPDNINCVSTPCAKTLNRDGYFVVEVALAVAILRGCGILDAEKGTKSLPGVWIYLQLDQATKIAGLLILLALIVLSRVRNGARELVAASAWFVLQASVLSASGILMVRLGARTKDGISFLITLSKIRHILMLVFVLAFPHFLQWFRSTWERKMRRRIPIAIVILSVGCAFSMSLVHSTADDMSVLENFFSSSPCPKTKKRAPDLINECSPFLGNATVIVNGTRFVFQFPSVVERVRYYMGGWDAEGRAMPDLNRSRLAGQLCPPGLNSDLAHWSDRIMLLDSRVLSWFPTSELSKKYPYSAVYFKHITELLSDTLPHEAAAIVMFGDHVSAQVEIPIIVKARQANRPRSELQTVLWPLEFERHFGFLRDADCTAVLHDTRWEAKRDALVWRGATTGRRFELLKKWVDFQDKAVMDVGFTALLQGCSHSNPECASRAREELSMQDLVQYRFLLAVEGNDVSTGLKWMLFSNSVVLMAPPTVSSWAMEDLLVPFVHFVPLKPDLSDLLDSLQWARAHPSECQAIACRSTEFIARLFGSERAEREHSEVIAAMRKTYLDSFGKPLAQICR